MGSGDDVAFAFTAPPSKASTMNSASRCRSLVRPPPWSRLSTSPGWSGRAAQAGPVLGTVVRGSEPGRHRARAGDRRRPPRPCGRDDRHRLFGRRLLIDTIMPPAASFATGGTVGSGEGPSAVVAVQTGLVALARLGLVTRAVLREPVPVHPGTARRCGRAVVRLHDVAAPGHP